MKLPSEILLALAYVSQISNPDVVRSRFIEAMNSLDEGFKFEFAEHLPPGIFDRHLFPISTIRSNFGYAVMDISPEAGEDVRVVFKNAFQFLATILENRMQSRALESRNQFLLKEINLEKSMIRTLLDTIPVGVWVADENGKILMGNAADGKIWNGARHSGKAWWSGTAKQVDPEEWGIARAIRDGQPVTDQEIDIACLDGQRKTILHSAAPLLDDARRVIGAISVNQDITERKRAEAALRASEEDLKESQRIAHVGSWRLNISSNQVVWSEELYKMYGFDPALPPPPYTEHRKLFVPESWGRLSAALENTRMTGIPYELELETVREDGSRGWMWVHGEAVRDANGQTIGLRGAAQDIAERKLAEAEKEKLQTQLLQAQKMESVGRLAGGVAHDYNNMLTIILGYLDLAIEKVDPGDPLLENLLEIMSAAKRSVDITRQLLAFARKQTVAPKVLDLNKTVVHVTTMMQRLIGENITLAWMPGANLWHVRVDPSQIDQILANLCVNARDAIADIGKVTIETANVTFDDAYCADHLGYVPGDYVLLSVSDDGCGMDKETLTNLFEPFFTTKNVDKGTGLGLATVYGIVKQNSGFINVYSEPNHGTSFGIYLPRYEAATEPLWEKSPVVDDVGGGETILLVEDDRAILKMTTMMLERLGYTVLGANTPGEAIRLAREHSGQIHLLMTDVVMPEMNGRDLAKTLSAHCPFMKRLFMSGYTANVIAHHGVLDAGVQFIQKPFARQALASKLREVLAETE